MVKSEHSNNILKDENIGMILHPHSEQMFTDNFRRKMFMLGNEPTMFRMFNNSMFLSNQIGNNLIVENFDIDLFGFLDETTRYNNWLGLFCKENFLVKNNVNSLNKMLPRYTIIKIYKETVYYQENNNEELKTISLLYLRDEVFQGKCFIVNPIKFVESIKVDKVSQAIKEKLYNKCGVKNV